MRWLILSLAAIGLVVFPARAAPAANDPRKPEIEKGTVRFAPAADQKKIPKRYRLAPHQFDYEMTPKYDLPNAGVEVFRVRYPSPVKSACPENNTVYAEYYRPKGVDRFPCVILLDVTAGDQSLSRNIATILAQNRIGGLFVQMAYYGPRRPPGSKLRLLSTNLPHTLAAVRQTVLDLRRAAAWMESRPEIDGRRLGIMGTSLGSFMAALTAEMEPKLGRVAVLLGGGGLVDAYYDHPQAAPYRKVWETLGGTKKQVAKMIAPVDPLTCAANLKDHQLLMIAGKRDEIVPPKAALALWKAAGEQKIIWYDCTHYGAVLYFVPAMEHVVKHFAAE